MEGKPASRCAGVDLLGQGPDGDPACVQLGEGLDEVLQGAAEAFEAPDDDGVAGAQPGDLRLPILVYSLAVCAMAAVAAGVDARVGLGGLLFLASDMLIGLDLADLDFPGRGTVSMVTYLAAEYLVVTGWARHLRRDAPVPG